MKILSGKSDRWGIGIFYCKHDQSLAFDFACWYFVLVFHKYWKN